MATRIGPGRPLAALAAIALVIAVAAAAGLSGAGPGPSAGPRGGTSAQVTASATPASTAPSQAAGPSASPSVGPSATPAPTATLQPAQLPTCPAETERFPTGYAAYHTAAELCRAVVAAAIAHPDIARLFSIGRSWQGRDILAMEISSHLSDGTHPPGVLFDGGTHGLEHLSVEMPLAIMGWLLDGYGHDPTITGLVATRAIFIVFDVNPDGAAFDIAGGRFHEWRKNRQPGPGGAIGTDLNRNYDDHWGCCGRVSATPSSGYYRGTEPFSAPETRAVRDLVQGLVFDGRQEIRAAITFHASGRLILWPYGYTDVAVPRDMPATDHETFVALATRMARLDGYHAEQASALYVDSGTGRDWYYGAQGIFAFTFELGTGTYQPSSVIATEIARNRSAILYLLAMAGCPDRATDAGASCG